MAFEIYSRKHTRVGTPQVSFMAQGRIAFNKAATQLLQEQAVENVLLLWDAPARRVGIRPIAKKDPRSYKINIGKRDNAAGFSAVTFLQHIGVGGEHGTQAFPISWNAEQGIFEISLADAVNKESKAPLLALSARREA